ncbi:hypothetical protein CYMTET_56160 [Cymbomonas tetramitiformis]|uniref:Uncharacterized protein n=1 Tax=Cymbomonas tetramitiformis TaxID=36881 RepID=A0AAE0BCU9_9CHLO|nr:hypothetical protein CYMTET_56160 [Cymbomonas tetramitiformis]
MHSVHKVCKRIVGIIQLLAQDGLTAEENQDRAETRRQISKAQSALVGTDVLEAQEALQGDSLKTFMNCTKVRLLVDRGQEVFGEVLDFRGLKLLKLTNLCLKFIYDKADLAQATQDSRIQAFYVYCNQVWCFAGFLDLFSRKKPEAKRILQNLHFHHFGDHIARFFHQLNRRPERLHTPTRSLVPFLEEDGEYYQMVSKALGKRSGNINLLDAMCTGEQIKDLQAMDYATGLRCEQRSRGHSDKLFSKSVVENLVIYACAYRLTPTWERNLTRLLWTILEDLQAHAECVFVFESADYTTASITWGGLGGWSSPDSRYHLSLYRARVARLYPEVPDNIKFAHFEKVKGKWRSKDINPEFNFKESVHYPHLQFPCLCKGCIDGFRKSPNKKAYAETRPLEFEQCICHRLPVFVFKVGETQRGADKYITVRWCEDTQLCTEPFGHLTPLTVYIQRRDLQYLEKLLFSL